MLQKNTKIVATISDKNCSVEFLKKLYEAGMNVVRINTAHQSTKDSLRVIKNVKKVSEKIPILLDTKGPEIRTKKFEKEIFVKKGEIINVYSCDDFLDNGKKSFGVSYKNFVKDLNVGNHILIDDGETDLLVIDKNEKYLSCKVENDGIIKSKKSINVPNVIIDLPSLSPKDMDFLKFAIENDIDFIAHSFVRNKNDILNIQKILDINNSKIKIIAKIENQEGVDNIDEILEHAYGIMVARGDLGIEISAEKIPSIQKFLKEKCFNKRKPVVIATQMLHTMINNPRPTRAEVSDVANAIYDRVDAIMLSGETAYGKYPIESVETMSKIAIEIEKKRRYFKKPLEMVIRNKTSSFLAECAVDASIKLDTKAIIADSISGTTIRNLVAYRSTKPIYAMCYSKSLMRELAIFYGVIGNYMTERETTEHFSSESHKILMKNKKFNKKDLIVVLAGNFGKKQGASFIEICFIEDLI
ncbi:MAG: pyruvate kinase [Bacteroidetes bacterium 4572_128]|nr:MAG: pyruvate kinase [Bacteroidetes bacterium 4572_128]